VIRPLGFLRVSVFGSIEHVVNIQNPIAGRLINPLEVAELEVLERETHDRVVLHMRDGKSLRLYSVTETDVALEIDQAMRERLS
jgi:hypothetical protein